MKLGSGLKVGRLNVALTRARHCLRVVGSSTQWSGKLRTLADDAKARGRLTQYQEHHYHANGIVPDGAAVPDVS